MQLARRGTCAVAAIGLMLGSWLFTTASSAGADGGAATVEWAGFAGNAQHTAVASEPPQPLKRIRWRAKVDLAPVLIHKVLYIHYGSPMITAANTVLVPTRISAKAG